MRVLVLAAGSGGDAIPVMETAACLASQGHDVLVLHSRSLDLSAYPLPKRSVGRGHEVGAIRDPALLLTNAAGMAGAWAHYFAAYVAPDLQLRLAQVTEAATSFLPDVLVIHPLAVEGYVVGAELALPVVALHLQADLSALRVGFDRAGIATGGTWSESSTARSATARYPLGDRNAIVSDPLLVGSETLIHRWGEVPVVGAIAPESRAAGHRDEPTPINRVLVTAGSFLGYQMADSIETWVAELRREGFDVEVIGPGLRSVETNGVELSYSVWGDLSVAMTSASVVVHHAGVGTAVTALRSGRPSVTFPRMFDQHQNAAQLNKLGVAVALDSSDPAASCREAIALDPANLIRARERCVPQGDAISALVGMITDLA